MKFSLIVVSIAALCIQSTFAQPAVEIDNNQGSMVTDMVQDGWPEDQAQVIVSLFDAVDALPEIPERNQEDSDEARYFDNLRVDASQVLAQAGYGYKSVGSRRRVLTRLAGGQDTSPTTPPPGQHNDRKEAMVHALKQLVSLINSAHTFIGLLDNPTLSDYSDRLLNAAQSIEKLVAFPDP